MSRTTTMLSRENFCSDEDFAKASELGLKPIPDHPSYFLQYDPVTHEAVIWSTKKRGRGDGVGRLKVVKQGGEQHRRIRVGLSRNGKRRQVNIGEIVYITLVGPMPEGTTIDHIDRDFTNQAVSNLRTATKSQQNLNRGPEKGRMLKGVSWDDDAKKMRARARIPTGNGGTGKKHHIGLFNTIVEAAEAYDDYLRENLSEEDLKFAYLNFPNR